MLSRRRLQCLRRRSRRRRLRLHSRRLLLPRRHPRNEAAAARWRSPCCWPLSRPATRTRTSIHRPSSWTSSPRLLSSASGPPESAAAARSSGSRSVWRSRTARCSRPPAVAACAPSKPPPAGPAGRRIPSSICPPDRAQARASWWSEPTAASWSRSTQPPARQRWRVQMSGEVLAPPLVSGDRVIVRTVDGRLRALAVSDGKEVWTVEDQVPRLSLRGTAPPVLAGDAVVGGFDSGARDGGVACERRDPLAGTGQHPARALGTRASRRRRRRRACLGRRRLRRGLPGPHRDDGARFRADLVGAGRLELPRPRPRRRPALRLDLRRRRRWRCGDATAAWSGSSRA